VSEPNTNLENEPQPDAASSEAEVAGVADVAAAAPADPDYGATWFNAQVGTAPGFAKLSNDLDADVCIIGGGLAGLLTALEMARRGWSVVVLEERRVAWNASSRNTGFVRPGFFQSIDRIVERVGVDDARELWALSQDGLEHLRRSIDDGASHIIQSEGSLQISKTNREREIADKADLLRGFGADIEVWPAHLVRSKVKSPYYFQAIHFPTAFNLDAYAYARHLIERAEAAGVRIFEQTPAVAIDPAGVRKRIITPHGRVRAAHIVLTGNVHLGRLVPEVAHMLIPLETFAIVTKPLGDRLVEALDYRGAVSDSKFAGHHYRIVGGDRLMFGGRLASPGANPRWHGYRLRSELRARFPQLGRVEVDHAWGGTIGLTVHLMPQIGEVSPGVWLASGFGPQGLNTAAMAALLISGAIAEGDDRFRLFEPFELVWGGGRMGRLIAKHYHAGFRRYEDFASRQSRRREVWWSKNEPRLKKEAEEAAERARILAEQAAAAEAERREQRKIEAEQAELRRIERERIAAEKAEAKRIHDAEKSEAKRLRAEQKAAAKAEAARLKEEQRAAARAEKERIAAEAAAAAKAAEAKRPEAE